MTKRRTEAGAPDAPEQQQTVAGALERIAALGWDVAYRADYDAPDGVVARTERILLTTATTHLQGTGATFDAAFLDLGQNIMDASVHLMDLASVVQDIVNDALAAHAAAMRSVEAP